MLRIWGRISSINVQKVVWCADELGIRYERVDAGGKFGRNDTPEYLAMNPNGLVPVIEDAGFVLWESNAILRYLCERERSTSLWPQDVRARADADRWLDWQATSFTPATRDAFWNLLRVPEPQRDHAAVEASRAKSEKCAAILEAHLAGREYVCGDSFCAADIALGAAAHRWLNMTLARTPRPGRERWYQRLKSRPASRQVTLQTLS
jgi:glutathione S-transferase